MEPRGPEAQGPWGTGALGHRDPGAQGPWGPGALGPRGPWCPWAAPQNFKN